ncbi:MAG: hypothetical protein U0136_20990 [Bdellovibrionota bacterium]
MFFFRRPNPRGGKSGSRAASGLLFLVLAAIGTYRGAADQNLVKYHNEFVLPVYSATVVHGWPQFVQELKGKDSTAESMAGYVKEKFLPQIEKFAKDAGDLTPPEFATDFHSRLSADLVRFAAEGRQLASALENEDSDGIKRLLGEMRPIIEDIDEGVADFQKRLKEQRDFKFEQH